ncbi:MAG: hypothetical protein FJ091_05940 [Deltaproteobacteria bacterium]|nr:hypothetical protein [Deltaproteobacteria bacterium]
MRQLSRIALLAALALASPALAQTPATETITFEGVATPIPFESLVTVPKSARVKKISLAGGGFVSLRTRGGAKYAALVTTHLGTAVVGVNKKGRIQPRRLIDMRIRKSRGARFDSFTPVNIGARIDDKGTTTGTNPNPRLDDEIAAYDGPGGAQFRLFDAEGRLFPLTGNLFFVQRSGATKVPFDLTTTSEDFTRIQALSDGTPDTTRVGSEEVPNVVAHMAYDDLVVSYGH